MGPVYQLGTSSVKSFYLLFCIYFVFFSRQERFLCPFPHNEGPVYHVATGFVNFFRHLWSFFEQFPLRQPLRQPLGRLFFSAVWSVRSRYLANLYHTKLYLILYLPLRDLSGVLWYSVVSSPRNIKDLLCRKSPELRRYLFFFLFMVSWRLWRFSVVYYSHFSDILRLDTCTYSRLIYTLLRQVFL